MDKEAAAIGVEPVHTHLCETVMQTVVRHKTVM